MTDRGVIKGRGMSADSLIIRAHTTTRTDGFSSVQSFAELLRAARAPRAFGTDTHHPYQKHEVWQCIPDLGSLHFETDS